MRGCGYNDLAVVKVDGLPQVFARPLRVCARPVSAIARRRRRQHPPEGGLAAICSSSVLRSAEAASAAADAWGKGGAGHGQFVGARLERRRLRDA